VTARLTDPASADELIRSINALKMLLRPASEIKKPDEEVGVTPAKPKNNWI
jgi:hypothetical protein